jgi:hypothetical protein
MKKRVVQIVLAAATLGYLVAIGIYIAPTSWDLSPLLVFGLCPPALASLTVDPSITTVALISAPLNAVLYGGVGLLAGLWIGSRGSHTT